MRFVNIIFSLAGSVLFPDRSSYTSMLSSYTSMLFHTHAFIKGKTKVLILELYHCKL